MGTYSLFVLHGGRGSCSEQGVTRVWRPIRAPAWLLLTSSPPPQARRPWLRAGRQVVRSDRPGLARFAGAGALDTSWCGPNARAFRGGWAGADRKHLTRGVLGAKTKGARACWGLQGRGRGGSALASGKCSCLWLRNCSLARSREVRCWCYPACSGAGARRGARTLGSIRARDAWHRLVRSERDPRRSEAQTRTREVRAAAVLPSELSYEGCQPRSFPAGCFRNPQRSSLRSTKRAPRRRQSRTRECGQSKGRRQQIQSLPRRRYRKVCAISI